MSATGAQNVSPRYPTRCTELDLSPECNSSKNSYPRKDRCHQPNREVGRATETRPRRSRSSTCAAKHLNAICRRLCQAECLGAGKAEPANDPLATAIKPGNPSACNRESAATGRVGTSHGVQARHRARARIPGRAAQGHRRSGWARVARSNLRQHLHHRTRSPARPGVAHASLG
jgi:hypothetical protein